LLTYESNELFLPEDDVVGGKVGAAVVTDGAVEV